MNRALLIGLLLLLGGCATVPQSSRDPADPWESYNRTVFKFNDAVDKAVLKPVARGYQKITPDMVETGVSNFFSNLSDVGISLNNLLQGEPRRAGSDLLRFVLNSTFGLVGVIDVASSLGLEKHAEDFGQTMAVWGVPSGPYFVLPFFGPSTIRDTAGFGVDLITHYPWRYLDDRTTRYFLTTLSIINLRSEVLKVEDLVGTKFYDRYASTRDAWLQYRDAQIKNGDVANSEEDDEEMIRDLEELDEQ